LKGPVLKVRRIERGTRGALTPGGCPRILLAGGKRNPGFDLKLTRLVIIRLPRQWGRKGGGEGLRFLAPYKGSSSQEEEKNGKTNPHGKRETGGSAVSSLFQKGKGAPSCSLDDHAEQGGPEFGRGNYELFMSATRPPKKRVAERRLAIADRRKRGFPRDDV